METTVEQITALFFLFFLLLAIITLLVFDWCIHLLPSVKKLKEESTILSSAVFDKNFSTDGKSVAAFLRIYIDGNSLNFANNKTSKYYLKFDLERVFKIVSYQTNKLSVIAAQMRTHAFVMIISSLIALCGSLPSGQFKLNFDLIVSVAGTSPFKIVTFTDVVIIILSFSRLLEELRDVKKMINVS
jgi:hypothetical protein